MKNKIKILAVIFSCMHLSSYAQIKINTKAVGAIDKGVKAATFSDADAAAMAKEGIDYMDAHNKIPDDNNVYSKRLNRLFAKHKDEDGMTLNYKVYDVLDINAFACADGSVRVFSSLMDILTDAEILAVIGHEIGHVKNKDSRDAVKAAYKRAAIKDAAASQSNAIAALSESELGKMADGMLDSKHSRKQESEADSYSYEFMKKHGYNVMGAYTAFMKLAKLSEGGPQQSKLERMYNSHPDSKKRAEEIKEKAIKDGLWVEPKPEDMEIKQIPQEEPKKVTPKKEAPKKK